MHRTESRRGPRQAFTLMEMLVVVAIIVALSGIAVVSYFAIFEGSKKDIAQSQVKSLSMLCDLYRIRNGNAPDALQTLMQPDVKGVISVEDPNALLDPWKKPYQYDPSGPRNSGRHADIWTIAPDGLEIGNWPKALGR